MWLADSSAVCQIKNGQVARLTAKEGIPPGIFHSMINDGDGNIWLAKGRQIGFFRNGQFQHAESVQGVQCLAATHTNAVWFVAGAHLFTCDIKGTLRDYGAFQSLSGANTTVLLEDHTGAVWIGTDGIGLFRYSESGFERIETSHPSILSLAEDREGNIWVGTAGGGLNRVSLCGVQLEDLENNQVLSQIQSICQDTHGVLWGATQDGALVSRINDKWKPVLTNAPFAGTVTCVAAGRDGAVWIGTRNGKLLRLVNTNCTTWGQSVVHGDIRALLSASKGDLWIVGAHALLCLHDGQLQDVKLPRQVQHISAITEDATGNIWVGARGIVMRFNGKVFEDQSPRLPISDRNIFCLYATADGSVWISCGGVGLLRFKDGHVGQIGVEQGLFDDYIEQIVADDHGWLWFGSDRGIFKIRQHELEQAMEDHSIRLRSIVYGRNEGLISLEAICSTAIPNVLPLDLLAGDGRVWLLMHTGVVVADPKLLPENLAPPPVLLTQVAVDGQTIASYGGVASTQTVANLKTLNVPLRLPPSNRHLEFDFAAFHFSAPENIHFRYQLAGFDNDWIDAGTQRSDNYSRLPAGNYEFHVEACIGDGLWSETPARLAFNVAPFFWQTWWFRLGALLLSTSLVIAIVRYVSFRRMRWKLRAAEQQAAIEKERGRIAHDIHDDLGNRLTEIQLLSGLAQDNRAMSDNSFAEKISAAAQKATDALDEIVWAINPRNDTLPHLIDYLGEFAVEFLQTAGIRYHVDLPEQPPVKPVSAEVRHNLFLAIKESLNNIVQHAGATEVLLTILVTDGTIRVIIEDNGRGFNGEVKNNGADGLRNMRQRMAEIGGQFHIKSEPGSGTRVSFNGPWLAKE